MSIIKEAAETKEQLQLRLDSAEDAYNSRKAEMEDDSFWSQMSRGAKMSYLSKLKSLEDDITRITRRLARAEEAQPMLVVDEADQVEGGLADKLSINDIATKHNVSMEHLQKQIEMGIAVEQEHTDDTILAREIAMDHLTEDPNYYTKLKDMESKPDSNSFDIEKEIIADEPTSVAAENDLTDRITLRREIESIINSTEDLIINNLSGDEVSISAGLQDILAKFKEIRDVVENGTGEEDEPIIKVIKLEGEHGDDVNTDSDVVAVPAPSDDERELLKGNTNEEVDFTEDEIDDAIETLYYAQKIGIGKYRLDNHNGNDFEITYKEPDQIQVGIKSNEEDAHALCNEIKEEILYKLKLNKVN